METGEILDTSAAIGRQTGTITVLTALEYPPSTKKSFTIISPETIDYVTAIDLADKLREKGKLIGAIDIIIAAICLNRSATLITKDKHFRNVKEIYPEFAFREL